MEALKLTIELIPKTCWYTSVRSNVSKKEWDKLRKESYEKVGYKCEICGDNGKNQGYKHMVECHEIWQYDETVEEFRINSISRTPYIKRVQRLISLVSLCPKCHLCKHPGLAQINGKLDVVIDHLMKVNNMSFEEAEQYLESSFEIWNNRSMFKWHLDISYLKKINNVFDRNLLIEKWLGQDEEEKTR